MESQRFGNRYVLRLMPGEELRETLTAFADSHDIRGGYFVAFGAFCRATLQYFDIESRQYRDNEVNCQVEVVSLTGNIARGESGTVLHIHGAFGDAQARTYSGHVAKAVVRPTLELFLTDLGGELRRKKDPETGLELLALAPDEAQPGGEELEAEQEDVLVSGERL
ncbi:MAG TPA: PPC domain-containing DNA-binding protein, partial [Armatimonadota bacterium]|nr:PPC domain-containing DNA-binding protein [Armatimonadota bacterium]